MKNVEMKSLNKVHDELNVGQSQLKRAIEKIDTKIEDIDTEIFKLRNKRDELNAKKQSLIEQKVENEAEKLAKSHDWESPSKFPWSEKIHTILKDVFNLSKFRHLQLSVINATLSGNDVLVIMPTGGGKSLCYQLPSLVNQHEGEDII